jgi:hypothetical protein
VRRQGTCHVLVSSQLALQPLHMELQTPDLALQGVEDVEQQRLLSQQQHRALHWSACAINWIAVKCHSCGLSRPCDASHERVGILILTKVRLPHWPCHGLQ